VWIVVAAAVLVLLSGPAGAQDASPTPGGTPEVLVDRGDAARTGVFPGPGPARAPVERWRFALGQSVRASPLVAGGHVYIAGLAGTLYALDAASGQERWRFTAGGPVQASPVLTGGVVYVGSDDGFLYAIGGS
jgi:outer membrane protein assembly factor BamB